MPPNLTRLWYFDSALLAQVGDFLLGLAVAIASGWLLGVAQKQRGLRTDIKMSVLICLGATIFSFASVSLAQIFSGSHVYRDPARISAQVVTGFGFLGGMLMLRGERSMVQMMGPTFAATLWLTGIVGILIGMGFYGVGFAIAILLMALHRGLDYILVRAFGEKLIFQCTIEMKNPHFSPGDLTTSLESDYGMSVIEYLVLPPTRAGRGPGVRLKYEGKTVGHQKFLRSLWDDRLVKSVRVGSVRARTSG